MLEGWKTAEYMHQVITKIINTNKGYFLLIWHNVL